MLSLQNVPFVKLLGGFLIGLSLSFNFENSSFIFFLSFILIGCFSLTVVSCSHIIKGHFIFFVFVLFGFFIGLFHKHQKAFLLPIGKYKLVGLANDVSDEKAKVFSCAVTVIQVEDKCLYEQPKLLVYLPKSEKVKVINRGDTLVIEAYVNEVKIPENKFQFDYKNYLENQWIYRTAYVASNEHVVVKQGRWSVMRFANFVRDKAQKRIKTLHLSKANEGVLEALLLGLKSDLTDEVKQSFTNTGATHVLAVSGLHVGIIFMVLNFFFKSLKYYARGQIIYAVLMLLGVWSFAFITGLAASVTRASIMFTIIIVAKTLKRDVSIYNTISASALLMLVYNPYLLFDVGFQLSYSAVTGIVFLHPKIYAWFGRLPKFLDRVWSLTAVSIAAQFSTLPFTIYYFHQLPSYFWLSNLIVIPAATLILYGGMGFLIFGFVPPIHELSSYYFELILSVMNWIIACISKLPFAVLQNIYVNTETLLVLLIGIVCLVIFLIVKKVKMLQACLIALMLFFTMRVYQMCMLNCSKKVITIKMPKENAYLIKHERTGILVVSNKTDLKQLSYAGSGLIGALNLKTLDTILLRKNELFLIGKDTLNFSEIQ